MKKHLNSKLALVMIMLTILGFIFTVRDCNSAKLRANPTTGKFEWTGDNDVIKANPTTGKFEYVNPDTEIRPNPTTGKFEWVDPD